MLLECYDSTEFDRRTWLYVPSGTPLSTSSDTHKVLEIWKETNKAVKTIWRALYKPPQKRQDPDPRPLWLLVGSPSAFGPELAYRLRVVQPTLMDVRIFLIYFYITIHVCVPHFYDLSALVGCWSSVSIRRIIYKFLNVCPFDYTAVAVSGKVERS